MNRLVALVVLILLTACQRDGAPDGPATPPLITPTASQTTLADVQQIVAFGESRITGAVFGPDGRYIATPLNDRVILWDATTFVQFTHLQDPASTPINQLAFSDDLLIVAESATDDAPASLVVWDVESQMVQHRLTAPAMPLLGWMVVQGDRIATPTATESILLWDARTGQRLATIPDDTTRLAFSPDGRLLATAGYDSITLWEDGARLAVLNSAYRPVRSLAFSPDGRWLLTGHRDGSLHLWDVRTRRHERMLDDEGAVPTIYAFSDEIMAVGDAYGRIVLWDRSTWEARALLVGHNERIAALAFSPAGDYVVSAGDSLRIWNVEAAAEVRHITAHQQPIQALAFGQGHLLSFDVGGTVRLWAVPE